jgi:hypothetical protein
MRESSSLAHKYETRLVSQAGDKCSSLFVLFISEEKQFFKTLKFYSQMEHQKSLELVKLQLLMMIVSLGWYSPILVRSFLSTFVNTSLYRG